MNRDPTEQHRPTDLAQPETVALPDLAAVSPAAVETSVSAAGLTALGGPQPAPTLSFLPGLGGAVAPIRAAGYEVLELLGRGGMGIVLKARHKLLQRLVAIKQPLSHLGPEGLERFLREARSAAQLRHPNICPIHEVGESDGLPYLVLEFIDGETLSAWAKRVRPAAEQVAKVLATLARAVAFAHDHGVVHRDIKPSNVMLDRDRGEPILMDFGLAKQMTESEAQMTSSGQMLGTPAYMAPEQAAGRIEQIGPPADVYSLGAVLYELLTGHLPFEGAPGEVVVRVQTEEPRSLRQWSKGVPRDLETICQKAMQKSIVGRYASAHELAADLERFAAGEPILARRESLGARLVRQARKRRRSLLAAASLVAACAGTVVWFSLRQGKNERLAAFERELEQRMSGDWSPGEREAMESIVAASAALDPAAGETHAARLGERFAQRLRSELAAEGRFDEARQARVTAGLDWLETRRPDLVPALREAYAHRLRAWGVEFDLVAPFDELDAVFTPEVCQREAGVLRRRPAEKGVGPAWTRVFAEGDVRLRAVWNADWRRARRLSLILQGEGRRGLEFSLAAVADSARAETDEGAVEGDAASAPPITLGDACQGAGTVAMEISRDGVALRRAGLPAAQLAALLDNPLEMLAQRQGSELQLRVHDLPPLRFTDVFAQTGDALGTFGLDWPASTGLLALRSERREMARAASPLEQADREYSHGAWETALAQYQHLLAHSTDEPLRREARFKAGLCLLELDRDTEAADTLLPLLEIRSPDAFALAAACQVWLVRLRHDDFDAAEALYQYLTARSSPAEMAATIPDRQRREICNFGKRFGGYQFLAASPEALRQLEHTVSVDRFLQPEAERLLGDFTGPYWLMRAYHMSGRLSQALDVGRELVEAGGAFHGLQRNYSEEYVYLLRLTGDRARAREIVDRGLATAHVNGRARWVLDDARLAWDGRKFDRVEQVLRALLADTNRPHFREFDQAHLMLGFVEHQRGDPAAARETWRQGFRSSTARRAQAARRMYGMNGTEAMTAVLLGALCEELTVDDVLDIQSRLHGGGGRSAPFELVRPMLPTLVAAARGMCRSQRGIESSRKIAFRELSLPDSTRALAVMLGVELIHQSALNDWTKEQEAFSWSIAERVAAKIPEQIALSDVLQLGMAWKGQNNILGWKGVASRLPQELLPGVSCVLGYRYRALNRGDEAREFFQAAARDPDPKSPARLLAERELQTPR